VSHARNLLLVVADQWRGDLAPGYAAADFLRLPTLRRLAAEGVTFRRHYAQASPCGPARASLLTGMYAMNHRVVQNRIPMDAGILNLGEVLRRAGHLPALIGYTSWMPDPRTTTPEDYRYRGYGANMPGWRVLQSMEEPDFEAYFGHLEALGHPVPAEPFDLWRAEGEGAEGILAPARVPDGHSDTAWATDAALRFIKGRRGRPWVLHLGYWRPHPPYSAPAPWNRMHDPEQLSLPPAGPTPPHALLDHLRATTPVGDFVQGRGGLTRDLSAAELRAIRAQYFGLMGELDYELGRVLDLLRKTGELDRTLVVFTSDHGEALGEHGLLGKLNTLDASFHVPLIIRAPEEVGSGGRVVDLLTESIDVMPTVLDWLGVEVPDGCDGASLLPLLRGVPVPGWREAAHMEFDFRDVVSGSTQRVLGLQDEECALAIRREARWKYVHFAALPPLLFDTDADPGETVNLAENPAHVEVALDLARKLLSWRIAHADRRLTRSPPSARNVSTA
jgi:arylsulfatase A-like enzyme